VVKIANERSTAVTRDESYRAVSPANC